MKKKEINRQILHMGLGLLTVLLIYFDLVEKLGRNPPFNSLDFIPELTRPFLIAFIITTILIIISKRNRVPGLEWLLRNFERQRDREAFPGKGLFFSFLAVIILSLFVKKKIVGASLIIISVGDSISHLIGRKFGKINHPFSQNKKIEGNIVGAFFSGIGACIFVAPWIAFIAAFFSMFIEGIDFGEDIDRWFEDNIFIPIIAAVIILLLEQVFL